MTDYSSMFDTAQGATPAADYGAMFDTAQGAQAQPFGVTDTWPFRLARGLYAAGKDAATLPGDVYTGAQNVNDPSTIDRAMNFATLAAPVNPAFGSGEQAIAGVVDAGKGAPTREALLNTATKQYGDFLNSGIKIKPEAMNAYHQFVGQDLLKEGITPLQAPLTNDVLDKLAQPPANSYMSAANYKALREALGKIAKSYNPANPADQAAATISIKHLDSLFNGLPQTGFMADTTPEAVAAARSAYNSANGNYAAAARSGTVTGKVSDAELRASAANSGRNIGNAIRQRMAGIIVGNDALKAASNKATRGFSPEELAGVADIVNGTVPMNAARYGANMLGGGGGIGHSVVGGAGLLAGGILGHLAGVGAEHGAIGGAVAAPALGLLGSGLKSAENALVRNKAAQLDELLRTRSPLAQSGASGPAANAAYRAALPRALALYLQQNPNSL